MNFRDQVVVVTGAGSGVGRCHALQFARRGARVVVNDYGVSARGDGTGHSPADAVVAEIEALDGVAVPNYDSVENGEAIIETALAAFGRVDVVVNNAGFLRDVSFAKITDDDWDAIYRVHALGTYKVCRAAWPVMLKQNYGRIVNTTSGSGIYGNFGQANYAFAKLGVVGLTQTLAIEGARKGITANTIAPVAGTRLTESVMPKALVEALKPEYITPLVVKLCAQDNQENGGLFEVGAAWVSKLRWERSQGAFFDTTSPLSAEAIEEAWDEIVDFTGSTNPTKGDDTLFVLCKHLGIDLV